MEAQKFHKGDHVWVYVVRSSEDEKERMGFFTWRGEGVVLGHVGDKELNIDDVAFDGNVVIAMSTTPEGNDNRIYHELPGQGPHVYEQVCYGGYWEIAVIVKIDQI